MCKKLIRYCPALLISSLLLFCSCSKNEVDVTSATSCEQSQQSTSEMIISEKEEIEPLNEDKMKSEINELFNDNILFWNYDDYDNDNIFEAVALIGEENFDVMNGTLVSINSLNNVTVIKENIACEDIFAFSVCDNTKYICLSFHTTQDRSLIYGLENNLFCETVISNVGQNFTVLDSCNDFTLIQSAFDNMTMGTEFTGSHTHKPYYFYYDNGFKEYGGTEITVNELKEYEGSEKILNIIEDKNGNVFSVLKRSNGIININYCVENVEQNIIWNYYLTVQLQDDNTLQYHDEGDGVYLSALVPEIAVY